MSSAKKIAIIAVLILSGFGMTAYGDWKIKAGVKGRWTYDSNVFNLSTGQITALNVHAPSDQTGGRFADMNRAGDHILRPSLSLAAGGPGLFGRKLELELSFDYEFLVRNSRRNNAELEGSLRQSLWKGGDLRISGRYVPKFFKRNYLIDGMADATGIVLPEDRIYGPGVYREAEGAAAYEQRLLTRKKTGVFGLNARLGAGLLDRRFQNIIFRGRDRRALALDAGLSMDFKHGWEMAVAYSHEKTDSPIVTEVLLLDETDFLIDFNGDGDLLDQDVRAVERVDRSFKADIFEGTLIAPLSGKTDLNLSVSRRLRRFLSQEGYDGYHNRREKRWVVGAECETRWRSNVSLVIGYRYYLQRASRLDLTGDEDDYLKHVIRAGLSFRF